MRSLTIAQVRSVLAGKPQSSGFAPFQMYPWDRAEVARRAYERTGHTFITDPSTLAFSLELEVRMGDSHGCCEITNGEWVRLTWSVVRRERGIRLFHAIAHALLRREGWAHSEADVWLVTLELAAPTRELRRQGADEVARQAHIPVWLVHEWARVALRLGAKTLEIQD